MSTFDHMAHDGFSETARQAYAACAGKGVAASALRLAEDGVIGVLASETVGGLGAELGYAVPLVAEAGASLLAFPLLEMQLVSRCCATSNPTLVKDLVAGRQVATIAWRGTVKTKRESGNLLLDGVVDRAPLAEHAQHVFVWTENGEAVLVPTETRGVSVRPGLSLALETPDSHVAMERVSIANPIVIPAPSGDPLRRIESLLRDALILQAAVMFGSAEAALAASIEHVTTRRQFGAALVANQAVRHMLARQKLGLEGVRSAIDRFFTSGTESSPQSTLAARAAFLHAAEVGIKTAEIAIQLHGGMGFTWDMPMHRHLRQIRTQAKLGGVDTLREAMAADLIDARNSAP